MSEERLDRIEVTIDRLTSRVDGAVHKLSLLQEDTRDDVKRIADGVTGTGGRFDRIERIVDEIKSTLKLFVQTQSAINGRLSSRDTDHQQRIGARRRRS